MLYMYTMYGYNNGKIDGRIHECIDGYMDQCFPQKGGTMEFPHPLILKFMVQNTVL